MSKPEFPCNRCGLCCSNLDKNSLYKHLDRGDGVCNHLDANKKLCQVYEKRPDICRVTEMYKKLSSLISYERYVELNMEYCDAAQRSILKK